MAPPEEKRPPVKKSPERKGRLTIMIMGSVGKVRSFQVSTRFFLWGILFFVGYGAFSLFAINSYIDLRRITHSQQERIGELETDDSNNKKALLRSRQHIALMEDYLQNLEAADPSGGAGKSVRLQEGEFKAGPEAPTKDPSRKEQVPAAAQVVDIADMVIQREGSRLTVNFKLVNAKPEESPVGGYLHIMALSRNLDPPKEWTHPQQKIEKGKPVNYRQGQIFLIHRFKQIQGRFNLGTSAEPPTTIRLLVYTQAGALILERDFEVRQGSS